MFDQEQFTNEQVVLAVFDKRLPVVTVYPFQDLMRLKRISVTLSLSTTKADPLTTLSRAVRSISNIEVTPADVLNFYSWISDRIMRSYTEVLNSWYNYVADHMHEIVAEFPSTFYWKLFKHNVRYVFPDDNLTYEQQVWIAANEIADKEAFYKLINDVRESLLPWLDKELYKSYQEQQKNRRENTAYWDIRKQMFLQQNNSKVKSIEKPPPSAGIEVSLDDEELDIIQ